MVKQRSAESSNRRYADNPTAGIKKQSVAQKEFPSFTHTQALKLLKQPYLKTWDGIRDFALLLVLADTGCRISEALFLTLSDII